MAKLGMGGYSEPAASSDLFVHLATPQNGESSFIGHMKLLLLSSTDDIFDT
ncbi:hypothetical protein C0995_016547 [Termitomyces sp. Mi166|nr:hypothetical protein C0995_016547 [Termitomyces sp. Mi166\